MEKRPSLIKILFTDAIASISLIFIAISWLLYLYFFFVRSLDASNSSFPLIFGVITVVAVLMIIGRVMYITHIFSLGTEVNATLRRVFFYRDRGSIDCSYFFQGQQFDCVCRVMKNRFTRDLEPGMGVVMLIDPDHPERAIIRDLFLAD